MFLLLFGHNDVCKRLRVKRGQGILVIAVVSFQRSVVSLSLTEDFPGPSSNHLANSCSLLNLVKFARMPRTRPQKKWKLEENSEGVMLSPAAQLHHM